jgi:hypothetical protein
VSPSFISNRIRGHSGAAVETITLDYARLGKGDSFGFADAILGTSTRDEEDEDEEADGGGGGDEAVAMTAAAADTQAAAIAALASAMAEADATQAITDAPVTSVDDENVQAATSRRASVASTVSAGVAAGLTSYDGAGAGTANTIVRRERRRSSDAGTTATGEGAGADAGGGRHNKRRRSSLSAVLEKAAAWQAAFGSHQRRRSSVGSGTHTHAGSLASATGLRLGGSQADLHDLVARATLMEPHLWSSTLIAGIELPSVFHLALAEYPETLQRQ